MPNAATTTSADETTRLVLGIARLGEQSMRGWWRSNGLGRGGQYVLGQTFPRTFRAAALELDIIAAAHRHDHLLRRPTALHLFSPMLPFRRWAEAWLAEQKTQHPDPLFDELVGWDTDASVAQLREWVGAAPSGEPVGDGLLLGQISAAELADEDAVGAYARLLAAAYLDQDAGLRPPYFDLAR
jgi:hypothetical protein